MMVDNGPVALKAIGEEQVKDNPKAGEVFADPTEAKRKNDRLKSRTGGARREKEKEYRVKVLCKVDGDAKPDKRKSICGTPGFMAPELDGMKNQKRREREGYGVGVDYFALGVTAYYMISGHLPSNTSHQYGGTGDVADIGNLILHARDPVKYGQQMKQQKIGFPTGVSEEAQSFVMDCMHPDITQRLGCCEKNGREQARQHKWFTSRDLHWDLLLAKVQAPPFIPKLKAIKQDAKPKYSDYAKLMEACASKFGNGIPGDLMTGEAMQVSPWDAKPSVNGQRYFTNWDYISPFTYKMELGLEETAIERTENVRESVKTMDKEHSAIVPS